MCEQREESTSKEDQPLSQVAKCVSCSSALLFYRMAVYYPRNKKVKGLSSCRQPVGVLRWWGVKHACARPVCPWVCCLLRPHMPQPANSCTKARVVFRHIQQTAVHSSSCVSRYLFARCAQLRAGELRHVRTALTPVVHTWLPPEVCPIL